MLFDFNLHPLGELKRIEWLIENKGKVSLLWYNCGFFFFFLSECTKIWTSKIRSTCKLLLSYAYVDYFHSFIYSKCEDISNEQSHLKKGENV